MGAGEEGMPGPHRNRVTPLGEIAAAPLRGAWTGNRGCLHRGFEIVRPWASHHFLVCALEFKGWHQTQWLPGRLTWLFFHDEAVAFAAGHRPCALCRRAAYNEYRGLFSAGGPPVGFDALDRQLHRERVDPRLRRRRRLHQSSWAELPDGVFVLEAEHPELVLGGELVAWSADGYGKRRPRPERGMAPVVTPPSSVRVLASGYPVQIDASARWPRDRHSAAASSE